MIMNSRFLRCAAVLCQLLSLFPFVVLTEGIGFGRYVWWHYFALYAVFSVFYAAGYFCASWAEGSGFSAKKKPWALFFSRAAAAVPIAGFVAVCVLLHLPSGLFLYALPAAIIAFYGGHGSFGLSYCDVFSTAWFGLFFVSGIIASLLLWFSHDKAVSAAGISQLCTGFGVLIVIAAVLANQTNIDLRTQQRFHGGAVLPSGLRGYNAGLIAAVCAVTVGLFLFAKPAAELIVQGIAAAGRLLLSLMKEGGGDADWEYISENDGEYVPWNQAENDLFSVLNTLLVAAIILLVIRFRKEILGLIKGLFLPMFAQREQHDELPFVDEISEAESKHPSERRRRRTEQQLYREYKRETDPVKKFRCGYRVFLLRLSRTALAAVPTDTTSAHEIKGCQAFRCKEIEQTVRVYNDVRYGGRAPTAQELEQQETLIEMLR